MVHQGQPEIGQKIWDGDYWGPDGALALAKSTFEGSKKRAADRVVWMSSLFSALGNTLPAAKRGNWLGIRRAVPCIWHLRKQTRYFRNTFPPFVSADQAETIGGVLLKWSRLPVVGGRGYLHAAKGYAELAYQMFEGWRCSEHTPVLAGITLANIEFELGNRNAARRLLSRAFDHAPCIEDANQKSRAFRGVALLEARLSGLHGARVAMDLADAVSGIAEDVRKKNEEARRSLGL